MSEAYKVVKPISLYVSINGSVMVEVKKGDYDVIKKLLTTGKVKFEEAESPRTYLIKFEPLVFEIWCRRP